MEDFKQATTNQSGLGTSLDDATAELRNDAGAAADTARDALSRVKEEGAEQLAAVKEQATDAIQKAGDQAKAFAADHKDAAGDQIENVAHAIERAADTLDEGTSPVIAGYARDLAGGLKQVSRSVKSNSVEEIVGMVQDFGRQQPLAFLGAAALAGFVASRFVLSSAERVKPSAGGTIPADLGPAPNDAWAAPAQRDVGGF